jgi:hypothetical protein
MTASADHGGRPRPPHAARRGRALAIVLVLAPIGWAAAEAPAQAQAGEKRNSVGTDALDALTQPLSDLNLRNKDIPAILADAQQAPYDLDGLTDCGSAFAEVSRLDEVLGPDVDAPDDEDDSIVGKGLELGGNVLGGLIPFRGIVRQLSGANAERARWEASVFAGVTRRSYLKGFARGLGCPSAEETAVQSSKGVLGIDW